MPWERDERLIDMHPDGRFRAPAAPSLPARLMRAAFLVAALAGMLAVGLLAFGFALALIPVAVMAGLVAWAALRFQMWRSGTPMPSVMLFRRPGGSPPWQDPRWREHPGRDPRA